VSGLTKLRPSPAMVVACGALFVALGGTGYAVATGSIDSREIKNNTIRSTDVRNNSLRGRDVRNNSLRGRDVRNGTLTGSDVNESSLGKVSSAAKADSAANAAAAGGFRVVRVHPFTLTHNQRKDILTEGPLTLTANCRIGFDDDNDPTTPAFDEAVILIATAVDNAAYDAEGSAPDLDVATPEDEREFLSADSGLSPGDPDLDVAEDGVAIAPDGTAIIGSELYTAVNVLSQPGVCRFGGYFMVD
jgi:hypothetical protein